MLFGPPDFIHDPHTYVSVPLLYGKTCHLLFELEHKAMWVMKKLKMYLNGEIEKRLNGLNDLHEVHLKAYESSAIYKEKIKKYYDQKIEKREFSIWDLVLLFNYRLRLFSGKLKCKWTGPFLISKVFPYGVVEMVNKEGAKFTINGQRIKIYLGNAESVHEMV